MGKLNMLFTLFVGRMWATLELRHKTGFKGWEVKTEEEFVSRAFKNISEGHYIDAANLLFFADFHKNKDKNIIDD